MNLNVCFVGTGKGMNINTVGSTNLERIERVADLYRKII